MDRPSPALIREVFKEWEDAQSHLDDTRREAAEDVAAIESAARMEEVARDKLGKLGRAFSGGDPFRALVINRGSVVAFSGETTIVGYSWRVPEKEPLCRPEPPPEFAFHWKQSAAHTAGNYLVTQNDTVVAVYNLFYFRSAREVVADLLEQIKGGWEAMWGEDFVVWCQSRIMAVIHQSMNKDRRHVSFFVEPRNDPGCFERPWAYWPTYEEWVESGRGNLWKTENLNDPFPMADSED
jgi:hypothetical protein